MNRRYWVERSTEADAANPYVAFSVFTVYCGRDFVAAFQRPDDAYAMAALLNSDAPEEAA